MMPQASPAPSWPLEVPFPEPWLHAWWARGQLWMAPHSPYNPAHRAVPLLDCYLCVLPVAPGPDRVNAMLERVWPTISRADAAAFAGHATLVRAVARHYAEEGHAER